MLASRLTTRWTSTWASGHSRRVVVSKATSDDAFVSVRQLPLFPLKPKGVFLPGMTRTLHLYEPHLVEMMEEAMQAGNAGPNLMATAVLEPYQGQDGRGEGKVGPGNYIAGENFVLTNGCLVKVLGAKPYLGGYLARIRGEARLGVSGLPQVLPYMRADVFVMADMPVAAGHMETVKARVADLEDVMRDVQNLSSKYRCQETASIQQAIFWVHQPPLTPAVMRMPIMDSEAEASALSEGGDRGDEVEETDEQLLQRAARLSWAALQWLPESSEEEKLLVTQGRMLAMETQDVLIRLDLAISTMREACSSLAAKCALKSLQP